jgi:hypothetical protein
MIEKFKTYFEKLERLSSADLDRPAENPVRREKQSVVPHRSHRRDIEKEGRLKRAKNTPDYRASEPGEGRSRSGCRLRTSRDGFRFSSPLPGAQPHGRGASCRTSQMIMPIALIVGDDLKRGREYCRDSAKRCSRLRFEGSLRRRTSRAGSITVA